MRFSLWSIIFLLSALVSVPAMHAFGKNFVLGTGGDCCQHGHGALPDLAQRKKYFIDTVKQKHNARDAKRTRQSEILEQLEVTQDSVVVLEKRGLGFILEPNENIIALIVGKNEKADNIPYEIFRDIAYRIKYPLATGLPKEEVRWVVIKSSLAALAACIPGAAACGCFGGCVSSAGTACIAAREGIDSVTRVEAAKFAANKLVAHERYDLLAEFLIKAVEEKESALCQCQSSLRFDAKGILQVLNDHGIDIRTLRLRARLNQETSRALNTKNK